MSHPLPISDFRALRIAPDPDDFAGGDDGPDPPPTDQIDEDTWQGITTLPSDVSIRTSDHCGEILRQEYALWGIWLDVFFEEIVACERWDPVFFAVGEAGPEFQAATFDLLHGFYRQAAASLRSAIELLLAGLHASVDAPVVRFRFGQILTRLRKVPAVAGLDAVTIRECGRAMFGTDNTAWLPSLYDHLSAYAHARPEHSLGDLWRSNGPIYVSRAVVAVHALYVETFCVACVLAALGKPELELPASIGPMVESAGEAPGIGTSALRHVWMHAHR